MSGRILWGTGLENVLEFERLDGPATNSRLRAGSEQERPGAAGIEDAWTVGYDQEETGTLRWLGNDVWSGPSGAQAFLDWAREKKTFRYVPDAAFPDFWIDGCYLGSPTDEGVAGALEPDERRQLPVVLRNPTFDFGLIRRALFMEYAPGASPLPQPFTFAALGSRYAEMLTPIGTTTHLLKSVPAGIIRDREQWAGTRIARLEGAMTNLVANPENVDLWSTPAGATVSANTMNTPILSITGDKIVEDSSVSTAHMVGQTVTLTVQAGNRISGVCHVRASERTRGAFYVSDGNNGANRVGVEFNLVAQTAVAFLGGDGTSHYAYIRGLHNSWFEVGFSGTMTVTTASSRAFVRLHDGTSFTYTGNGTSGLFAWGAAVVELTNNVGSYPAGGVARVADLLTLQWPWKPQGMWIYMKFLELGGAFKNGTALARMMWFGTGTARAGFSAHGNARWNFEHWNDVGGSNSSSMSADIPFGATVELLGRLKEDGSTELRWTINGGAEGSAANATVTPFAPAWSAGGVGVNDRPNAGTPSNTGLILVRAGRNVNAITTVALARVA